MHERQLYVQENFNKKSSVDLSAEHTRYPWQPYPATGMKITLVHKFSYIHTYVFYY